MQQYLVQQMESDIENLGLEIFTKKDYILVKPPEGVNVKYILQVVEKVFSMPEFQEKDDIWIFRKGKLNIEFRDLNKIKEFAEKYYPKTSKGKKTAIVAEADLQRSLAVLYVDIGKDLPREIRILSDIKSAEKWITK